MGTSEREVYFNSFNRGVHALGKFTVVVVLLAFLGMPFLIGLLFDAMPDGGGILSGIIKVAAIYIPVSVVEFLVYAPMLGAGGSYLAFITGNLTNLKIPCAMNARDIAGVEPNSPESEIISTLSVAASALTTTAVVSLGVLLLVPLTPVLRSPVLAPAFDNVVPALFGALGLKYFLKSPRVAVVTLVLMTLLCTLVPSLISQTSILIIPAGLFAIGFGYLLDRKGLKL